MKFSLIVSMFLCLISGCVSKTAVIDSKMQDMKFDMALRSAVNTSHQEEMAAIKETSDIQIDLLRRIEQSLTSAQTEAEPEPDPASLDNISSESLEPGDLTSAEFSEWPDGVRIVFWSGDPCTGCVAQEDILAEFKEAGIQVQKIKLFWQENGKTKGSDLADKFRISKVPQVWLCKDKKSLKRFEELVTREEILEAAKILYNKSLTTSVEVPVEEYELVRNPGVRWNWDGDWNVSVDEAERHLKDSHGIEVSGLTMKELEIMHDNAHNGKSYAVSNKTFTSRPVRYLFSRQSRRFSRSRSCPIGGCP